MKKLKFKKYHFHPITLFILLTVLTVILSGIFSLFEMQATYSRFNPTTNRLESTLVVVENLCNSSGIQYIISNAGKNFMSFTTLSTLLIALIGVSVAKSTGLLDAFIKRKLTKLDNKKITFILIFLATISSLINEIGYVILIPLAAIIYKANGRNPLAGITAAFCGVAFGYGATIFVGSTEINLISTTEQAARLIDGSYHISLTSNLFAIIVSTIVLSIVGTLIIEKIIIPKLGKYKEEIELDETLELKRDDVIVEEQQRIEIETKEKKGLKYALIAVIIVLVLYVYSLIPNLPLSGKLLDMNAKTYVAQLFGENSYFQDSFNYMVAILLIITGIAYGIGAKIIENDKDLITKANEHMLQVGNLIGLLFFASQFIAVLRKSNIPTIITAWGANIINNLEFTGIPLIILVLLVISITGLLNTTPSAKWTILAPVVVPKLMQSNVSAQFAQFLLRAGDSMTKGITPALAYFVIYIGYLNIYNQSKKKSITISESIKLIIPYMLYISLTWLAIVLLWYIIGLPIGPGVYPTLN